MIPKFLLPVLIAIVGSTASAGELEGVLTNNKGVKQFNEKLTAEAHDRFTGALADLPFSGSIHFNLGTSFLVNKEFEKALSEYSEAIRLAPGNSREDRETRFAALFNSAVALTEMKKNDEALELYQKALDIKPDSLETKTNIELLAAQGGGEGEGEDQKQNQGQNKDDKQNKQNQKPDENKDQKQQPKQPDQNQQKPKPTPQPFKSEDLSQQDVGRILEELKRQEEQIRARMQNEGAKDAPPDKDW